MKWISTLILIVFAVACAPKVSSNEADPAPVYPVPTKQQLDWHAMEMNAFIHFTTNTFTDKEWGFGDESPSIFNPTDFNPNQWTTEIRNAGFKGVILTAKHHDGFCLWPSKYTEHSVKNSPFKNGNGDVVKEVHDAARAKGLKFGIYLSPWDRNRADYGTPSYIEYYRNQLRELFGLYKPVFEMWFDGANGGDGYYGGKNERRSINGATYYQWPQTLEMVKQLDPDVLFFSDAGPHIRWVGNERGFVNETNWNTITPDTLYAGKSGIEKLLGTGSPDGTKWIPAEVDVSIRPGWFYHDSENDKVKTAEQLFDIYLTSVGRGSVLLLNLPPDKRGLLHENDVKSLRGFKQLLNERLSVNLAYKATATATVQRGNSKKFSPQNMTDGDATTYWATNDGDTNASFEIDLGVAKKINYLMLQEYIALGQRVMSFSVDVWENNAWRNITTATTIGYKRIVKLPSVQTQKLRVNITGSKAAPLISNVAVY